MHWSLADLREMDLDEYEELLEWARSRHEKESDSMDIDAVIDAKKAKAETEAEA